MKKVCEILKKARELITDPEHWTRDTYARDAEGEYCNMNSPRAAKFCALGAIRRVSNSMSLGYLDSDARVAMDMLARKIGGPSIAQFNDHHTHEEVLAKFDGAIKDCEDQ